MGCPLSKTEVEAAQCIYRNDAERATWERAFSSRPPLSLFTAAQRDECFINSVSYRFAAESSVCTKGEVLDLAAPGFLVLMRGSICVEESQGLHKKGLEEGDVVGLQECLHGVPPLRTVKAKTSAVVRLVKKEDLERAIDASSAASVARMGSFYNVLKATPVFLGLSDMELLSLQEHLLLKTFMAGESIIERGDRGDEMFILVEGGAVVSDIQARDSPTGPALRAKDSTKSAMLCFPNYFGEGALLVDEEAGAPACQVTREKTRAASVSAGPAGCSVLVVPQHAFDLHMRKLRHRFHRNIYSRDELAPSSSPLPQITPLLMEQDRQPHRALLPSEVKARGLWRVDQNDVVRRHATSAEKEEGNDGGGLWLSNLLCGAGLR